MSNCPNIQGLMDGQQWTWELYIDHMLNVAKLSNRVIILTTNESLFMRWWGCYNHNFRQVFIWNQTTFALIEILAPGCKHKL